MKGIVVGLALAALVLSCAVSGRRTDELSMRMDRMNEITALWTQIRGFRADMGMPLDPLPSTEYEIKPMTPKDSGRVCAENHAVPKVCEDRCTLSDHICENAELICKIADELGKNDRAQEKCTSGKASCREAKQKCCNCSSKPPVVQPDVTPTAPAPAPAATTPAPTTKSMTPVPATTKSITTAPAKKVAR